jgi:hypothetical protein
MRDVLRRKPGHYLDAAYICAQAALLIAAEFCGCAEGIALRLGKIDCALIKPRAGNIKLE